MKFRAHNSRAIHAGLLVLGLFFAVIASMDAQSIVSNNVSLYGWLDQHSLDSANNFVGNEACIPSSTVNGFTYLQNIDPSLFSTNLTGGTNLSSTQGTPNSYNNWVATDQTMIGLAGTQPDAGSEDGGTSVSNDVLAAKIYLLRTGYYSDVSVNFTNASVGVLTNDLLNSNAVVGVIQYTNGGGHGILLNGLNWNSVSNSGTLYFVDPLDPSQNYSGTNVLGPVLQTEGTLTQTTNGLELVYDQAANNLTNPYPNPATNTHVSTSYLDTFITLSITPSSNTNAAWSNLVIGTNSTAQTNIISSGTNAYSNTIIGYASNSAGNQLIVTNPGTLLSNSVDLYVGDYGASNSLIVSGGATDAGEYGVVGNYSSSSNNSVLVTGSNSIWTNAGDIAVGFDGSGNSMVISNGGSVVGGTDGAGGIIGADLPSSNNSVLVTGPGSTWSNGLNLYVGFAGSSNSLVISNSAVVSDATGSIGNYYLSSNNSVLVTSNGLWRNSGDLYIGNYGSDNSLVIANGGQVTDSDAFFGYTNKAYMPYGNSVLVTGSNSLWSNSGNIFVGYEGAGNSMVVSNGGEVIDNYGDIGFTNTSSNNSVVVTGTNPAGGASLWSNNADLNVGFEGASNSLVISSGGNVVDSNAYIGNQASSSNNSVTLTGSNSLWSNSNSLYIGNSGSSNSLIISNGGTVADNYGWIGYGATSSNNSVLVTGTNSLWSNSNYLFVGENGSGNSLVVSNGATLEYAIMTIGDQAGSSNNSVTLSGSNTTATGYVILLGSAGAYAGNNNSLSILNGARLTNYSVLNFNIVIGASSFSSYNSVLVSGLGSALISTNGVDVGYLSFGNSLIVSNGATLNYGSDLLIGDQAGASGNSVTLSGTNSAAIGYEIDLGESNGANGNSLSILNGATVANGGKIFIGLEASDNSLLVSGPGSILNSTNDDLTVGFNGNSNNLTITSGGSVSDSNGYIGFTNGSSGNSALVTGAASLWTNSDSLYVGYAGSSNSMTITSGGSVSDSNGYIGYTNGSSGNTASVSAGGNWSNSYAFYVGYDGYSNTLVLSGGGTLSDLGGFIGYTNTSSNNSVILTGTGSLWTNQYYTYVGYSGANNSLMVSNGASLDYGYNLKIAYQGGSGNSVIISGTNSSAIGSEIDLGGWEGSNNTLSILNGAKVTNQGEVFIGVFTNSAGNSLLVSGLGSILNTTNGGLYVGSQGNDNSLTISYGGTVLSSNGYVGSTNSYVNNNNSVLVTAGGLWSNAANLYVGYAGSSNSMTITSGGSVSDSNGYIGYTNGSSGNTASVSTGGLWSNGNAFYAGYQGSSNSLSIFGGGTLTDQTGTIGFHGDGNSVTVSGTNSLWNNTGALTVGNCGNNSQLVITNGGGVVSDGGYIAQVSGWSNCSVIVSGAESFWSNSGALTIGSVANGGNNPSSGNSLLISGGAQVSDASAVIAVVTNFFSNSVTVTGPGSLWSNSGNLTLGEAGSGNSLLISNGGVVSVGGNSVFGDSNTSTGNTALITGSGSLWSNAGTLTIGNLGGGTLTVANGGALVASQILIGQYGDLDIGRENTNDSSGTVVGNIVFTATNDENYGLNFSQTNSDAFSNTISGAGWVCQLGTGTTIMSGSNSYSLYTKIDAGTLVAASTNALGTGSLGIGGYADRAVIMLATNLTVGNFIWGSNGIVALTAGSQTLTVATMTNAVGSSGGNVFELQGTNSSMYLDNQTNTLIRFTSQTNFSTSSFSVSGMTGFSFAITNNSVESFMATNANVVVSMPVIVTNAFTAGSLTVATNGCVSGMGTINAPVTNSGTMIPGGTNGTPGTLTVNGNYTQNSSGSLQINVGTGMNSMLVVNGTALLGGTLVIAPSQGQTLRFGQVIDFLSATAISGNFSAVDAPAGFRARVKVVGDPVLEVIMAPASYTQMAGSQNQINVARALDSFIPATGGDQLVVSTALDELTASQYPQAFNQIAPLFYQQIPTIAFNLANAQNNELVQRLYGLRMAGSGFSMSGLADNTPMLQEGEGDGQNGKGVLDSKSDILRPGLDNRWGMFVDGYGIFAQANSANMLPNYNVQSGGVNYGLTYKWNERFGTGIYAGYQGSYSKNSGMGTLIDNAVKYGVFATYGNPDGKGLYADALAGGGYHNYSASRTIQFTGIDRTADSSPGAGEFDSMLASGYNFRKGNWNFGPLSSLQYTYLGVNSFNETGAQSLDLNNQGWNASSMISSVGGNCSYIWQANRDTIVVPQINLGWQHEFMQNPYAINSTLQGSPTFATWSAVPTRDTLYTGVGFTVEYKQRWNTSLFYNASAGNQNLTSENIFWSAGVKF